MLLGWNCLRHESHPNPGRVLVVIFAISMLVVQIFRHGKSRSLLSEGVVVS
jgi:hypothetical protein